MKSIVAGLSWCLLTATAFANAADARQAAPVDDRKRPAASAAESVHAALLAQARLWQSRSRDDLAAEALNKLLSTAPNHPEGLTQMAMLQLRANQIEQARQTLDQLRQFHPEYSGVDRLETLFRLEGEDRESLRQARMLWRAGRANEALVILDRLYPAGPPTGDLMLEYWQMVSDTSGGWERAYSGLKRLVEQYPGSLRYRLAFAEHVVVRRPADRQALKVIIEMSGHPLFERQARSSWRRAMLRLDPVASSIPLIEQYLAREEIDDTAVIEHLKNVRLAVAEHRRLMADPHYRARLDGIALLDAGKLDEADDRLGYALLERPADPEVLGHLGLIRIRQGRHGEAQGLLEQALRHDPGSSRWTNLLATARLWGLMREAADAVDAGEYDLALYKLEHARRIDANEVATWNATGRAYAAHGRPAEAEASFRRALRIEPNNVSALRGLASLYLRNGREGELQALLRAMPAAERAEAEVALRDEKARMYKEQAEALLAKGDTAGAIQMLESAARYDDRDPWLRFDLARLYDERGEKARAEAMFADLVTRRPNDSIARYAYALYLSRHDRRRAALSTLESVPQSERTAGMANLQRWLWSEVVVQRALELAAAGHQSQARRLLSSAESSIGNDPELALNIADARIDIGDRDGAKTMLTDLSNIAPPSVEWSLRHARLMAAAGVPDDVAPLVARLAARNLTSEQRAGLDDLYVTLALRRADALRAANRLPDAINELSYWRHTLPDNERLLSTEARYLRALGQYEAALANYRRLLQLRADNRDAAIAEIEVLVALERFDQARALVAAQLDDIAGLDGGQYADLVYILIDLQDESRAGPLARTALEIHGENPRVQAAAGQLARREGRIDDALLHFQRALAYEAQQQQPGAMQPISMLSTGGLPDGSMRSALEVTPVPESQRLTNVEPSYAYRRLAEVLDLQTTWLSTAVDHRSRSGTPGMSQYSAIEIPLEWKTPQTRAGRWTFRSDIVTLDAGDLDVSADGARFGSALLCNPACGGLARQHAKGVALNVALERGDTRYDVGTTPLGFPVQSLVGGILHRGDIGPFGYSLDLSRRPLTGSILSYAGAHDPRTNRKWGGVHATGLRLGLSLDNGGTFGGWSSLGFHRLAGTNVVGNNRMQLMAGGSVRVINEDDRLLQFGLTGMYWLLSRNAGEYTFGHGGYYSPGQYRSISLPVTFGRRHARLSYSIRASVSMSASVSKDAPYFPTDPTMQMQALALGATPFYSGGTSTGTGRSLSISWEYQADPKTYLGGRLDLERSPDYSPNRFVFYLRYALDRNSPRPVPLMPQPISPTSQY